MRARDNTRSLRLGRREFLKGGVAVAAGLSGASASPLLLAAEEGEVLYNGIRLPAVWPPKLPAPTDEPMAPPYLASPPAVIPIDVGRQLFVDDFLIESTTLHRMFHAAEYHPASPVLKPDRLWEMTKDNPTAMAFSDGAWYDPRDKQFKLWYMGGYGTTTCYATSADGIHWEKPALDVKPGTNIVLEAKRDSGTVWLDLADPDAGRRFKLSRAHSLGDHWGMSIHFSPDGIHWSAPVIDTGSCGDRSTFFRNPFRKVWVYSLRHSWGRPRRRRYFETPDMVSGPSWTAIGEPTMWVGADRLDPPREDFRLPAELYNLDCVAYESLLLGLFTIWRGQNDERPKPNQVLLGFSRDGFYWHRPERRAFLPVSERREDWNWGNVQSVGGGCLVNGDRLFFYCSGRTFGPGSPPSAVASTGLATLRRDGFASMDAADTEGTLTTRPVRFRGRHLFVNLNAPAGELRVEILDEQGQPIPSFSRGQCLPVRGDQTRVPVRWRGVADLSALAEQPVRFRFHLRNGKFYAFWVSPETSGASHGYVAAGGPGLTGLLDTVGASPTVRTSASAMKNTIVYREAGRFGGWPANQGVWAWGNEIVVGFVSGAFLANQDRHAIDGSKPEEEWQARSRDGGETWQIEKPANMVRVRYGGPTPVACPGGIPFAHPDFAMRLLKADGAGGGRLFYSIDRCRTWSGPFILPLFDQIRIDPRTDYLVNGEHDCLLFLTAAKSNGREGRVFCARTTDGGKTWRHVAWLGPEPSGFAIMPSSVRLAPGRILTTVRCKEGPTHWIDAYLSEDNGESWRLLNRPVASTGGNVGNPPSMIRLRDSRLCLTYGYRSEPFGMRARLSDDEGRTWGEERILRADGGNWDLGYPRTVQRADGQVVTVYYFNDRWDQERYIGATIWEG